MTVLVNAAEPTTDTSQSFAIPGLTRAQLLNGAFGVRVRATRGNNNTAFTASLDAVSVKVNYTSATVTAISVNAAGATTARGSDTFTYDQANRLKTATVAGTTETSTYDGDGVRFTRQVGAGPVIRQVTDPTAGLPVTIDDGTRKYVWGLGLAYAVTGSSIELYHTDRLGSVRAVSDASGTVTATYRTDEFGVPTTPTGSSTQPFTYTGEPRDATGLVYLRARYYDPTLGRFMSRDPFAGFGASPLSLNRYAYVGNNPATARDPSGQVPPIAICATPWTAAACVAAAGEAISFVGGVIAGTIGIVAVVGVVDAIQRPPSAGDHWDRSQVDKKQLEGLRKALDDLDRKLGQPGNEQAQNHWRRNKEGIQKKIDDILRERPSLRESTLSGLKQPAQPSKSAVLGGRR